MASKGFLAILLVMACISILMMAVWTGPACSFERRIGVHPGLAGSPATGETSRGVTGIQMGHTGTSGNSPTQPTGTIGNIKVNPHLPNIMCYSRCTSSCPGFRTPRDEQQCHQRCAAQCGG